MKKRLLPLFALMLGLTAASAQTAVTAYKPGVTAEGVTYYLPRTDLAVVLKVKKKTYIPGEFKQYAGTYLRLNDVPQQAYDEWQIEALQVIPYGVPDTSKVYAVALKKRTVAPLVSLSKDGILLSVNTQAEDVQPLPVPSTQKLSGKPINPRDFMSEDVLLAGSPVKMAELAANEILDIRDSRNALMKGQADYMPKDGEQLKLMLDKLDEQERALLQLFKGHEEEEQQTLVIPFSPTQDTERQVLFRFSQRLGILDKDNLAGAPIYISVKDLKALPEAAPVDAKTQKRQEQEDVRYNLPGLAKIMIFSAKEMYYSAEVKLAQLGRVEYLGGALFNRNATTRVTFYPETGAVKKLDAIQ